MARQDVKTINLLPLSGFVILEPLEETVVSAGAGSIHRSQDANKNESAGTVLAVGERYAHPHVQGIYVEPEVKVGDKVVFRDFGNKPYSHNGRDVYHVRFTDLFSIIKEEKVSE